MTTYYRGNRRRSYAPTAGRVRKPNRRPDACRTCGETVPAYGGELWRETSGAWSAVHIESPQGGWLMDPQPVTGGCPESTDKRNAELHAAGFFGKDAPMPMSEHERIERSARLAASLAAPERTDNPREASRTAGSKYAYTSTGARMTVSSRRCEDAPCCGCCD